MSEERGTRKIVINGKEYASADEMPPEIRAVYEKAMAMLADEDGNGVPDVLEQMSPGGIWTATKQAWTIAREAREAGIQSVELPDRAAPSTPSVTTTERRVLTSHTPPVPTEVGGSNLQKVLIAVLGAAALTFALVQLGIIE